MNKFVQRSTFLCLRTCFGRNQYFLFIAVNSSKYTNVVFFLSYKFTYLVFCNKFYCVIVCSVLNLCYKTVVSPRFCFLFFCCCFFQYSSCRLYDCGNQRTQNRILLYECDFYKTRSMSCCLLGKFRPAIPKSMRGKYYVGKPSRSSACGIYLSITK